MRVFAEYLKKDLTDLHQASGQVIDCFHGNQLLGECLASKHNQSGTFLIIFF